MYNYVYICMQSWEAQVHVLIYTREVYAWLWYTKRLNSPEWIILTWLRYGLVLAIGSKDSHFNLPSHFSRYQFHWWKFWIGPHVSVVSLIVSMQEHSHPDVLHKSVYIPFVWLTLISALFSHADVKHKPAMIVYDSYAMECVFQCTHVCIAAMICLYQIQVVTLSTF